MSDLCKLSHVLSPKKKESPKRKCPFASGAALLALCAHPPPGVRGGPASPRLVCV